MTDPYDSEYEVYDITLEELEGLLGWINIAPGVREFNTRNEDAAISAIDDAARFDQRVQIYGHDSGSDFMVPYFANDGHSPGASASYVTELIGDYGGLEELLHGMSPIGELGNIDFYQLNFYS